MPRVLVLEPPKRDIDLSRAEEYGEVIYLFDKSHRRASIFEPEKYIEDVCARLEELEPTPEDFYCIVGSLIPTSLAMIALTMWSTEVQLLLYSAVENRYVSREVRVEELEEKVQS